MNVNGYNISRNFNRNIGLNSQNLLATPLLNSVNDTKQNDNTKKEVKKNPFQGIKNFFTRIFNCCNPKAKENPTADGPRNSFTSIDSNLMDNDEDISQGLFIIENYSNSKPTSKSIPILVKNKRYNAYDIIYKNESSPLPDSYEIVSSCKSDTPIKTPSSYSSFYPHSYDSNEEWVKKYFNEKISNSSDLPIEDIPLEYSSSNSSF